MDFNLDVEYEDIRDTVPHKLYRPLVNPSNKVWRDSTKNKNSTSPFQIGDSIIYKNGGHNEMVDLVDVNNNDTEITKYRIKFFHGNTKVLTKEFLKPSNGPDISSDPIYSDY